VDLHRIHDAFKDQARFLTVYISEAHPEDEWQMDSNIEQGFIYKQPRAFEERRKLARILVDRLKYQIPLAIDPMDGRAESAFAAWPERIYILDRGGQVVYKAEPGPFGFKPEEAEASLKRLLAAD
jgi:type I thyroxine 5'-deiodinase